VSDTQLIDTRRQRDPSGARENRLSKRLAEVVGFGLLRRGGKRYSEAVIEGLGHTGEGGCCATCERPYVQEWAVKEMGRAMERALGHPSVQIQVLQMIQKDLGCRDQGEVLKLLDIARPVADLAPEAAAAVAFEQLQEHYRAQGKRLVLLDDAMEGTNGHAAG
jgi:hypothetical protein